jgi:hypothetical protein
VIDINEDGPPGLLTSSRAVGGKSFLFLFENPAKAHERNNP